MTGYDSKRAAAANKQEPAQESWREFASDYERGFIDGMQKQAQSSVDKAVNRMAQPAQEPVAWEQFYPDIGKPKLAYLPPTKSPENACYTTPPKREWVGLTDEEIAQGNKESWVDKQAWQSAVWWAEAKLKQKNGFAEEKNT
jgi:hypothetical protein